MSAEQKVQKTKANGITEGSIFGQLLLFFFPILFGTFFQQLYNTADAVVVGRFVGKQALAAVGGTTSTLINLMVGFFVGLSSGATVVISQYYGAKKADKVHWAVHTSVAFSVIGGVLFMAVGLVGARWALTAMHTPEDVMDHAVTYIRIYFLGMVPNLLYNMGAGILRAVGDSRRPLYFLIGSSISNILLDIFFVVWLKMGVAGVAWATFAAQGAASVLAFLTLLHRIKQLRSTEPYAKFSAEMLVQVTIVAIPSILQQCFVSIGNLFVQSAVNSYGSAVVAGFSACQKLNTFAVTCMTTLSNGVSSFTAQNLGADKKERVSEGFRAGALLGILVCVPFFLFYFFFGRTAMGLFLDESSAAAIQAGVDYMHIVTPFYFIVTIKVMCDGVLRGGSAMLYFMTTTFTDLFLRVALAFLFAKGLGLGATGIWMAWPFGWTLSALLSIFFYRLKPWLKKDL